MSDVTGFIMRQDRELIEILLTRIAGLEHEIGVLESAQAVSAATSVPVRPAVIQNTPRGGWTHYGVWPRR